MEPRQTFMKKIFYILFVTILFISCSDNTSFGKSKTLIKEYIIEHIDNPKSYEPINREALKK